MTSRRPMTRSYSGNGRTSSFSEEESSSSNGRSESRNTYLSNVRPENRYSHYRPTRSTLCSVMAQLTEDIQPSFETTLKSKAVSENCNVKFTCVVSGYPAPELKWYKDDMEMDRYCGLPKYEIRRNGKTHTLHIYNCTLDDAAIYQVSASNSKGIVSCSGVLEVGTMSEYQIHQRFFAKLKQKAEKKKKDMEEHSKKEGKENIQKEELRSGLEHPQRKRSVAPPGERQVVKKPMIVEQPGEAAESNGISSAVKEADPLTSTRGLSENEISSSQDTLAKKRIKMSNGVGTGVASSSNSNSSSKSHVMGNGGENCYDGGISLAQFLAETLQSQAAEEKQGSPREEHPKEMDAAVLGDSKLKDQEDVHKKLEEQEKALHETCEKEQRKEVEVATEREKEREKQLELVHTTNTHGKQSSEVKHHSKGHKDHDHLNIQASISSMLHTVKDFLFGKNKKDCHDHSENEDKDFDPLYTKTQSPQMDMPPSFQPLYTEHNPEICEQLTEEVVPMETDKTEEPTETVNKEQLSMSLEPLKDTVLHATDYKFPPKNAEESTRRNVVETDDAAEAMETKEPDSSRAGVGESLSGPQVHTEVEEKNSDVVPAIQEVPTKQQESDCLVALQQSNNQKEKDGVSPGEDECVLPQAHAPAHEEYPFTSTFNKSEACLTPPHSVISAPDNHNLGETFSKEIIAEKASKEGGPDTGKGHFSNKLCEEEKAEVKFHKHPCSDINRSELTKLSASSLEDRTELYKSKTPDQVFSPFSAVVACSTQTDHVKEETKCTSPSRKMNVGFPPTLVTEGLENSDLKMQHKCSLSEVGEITEAHSGKVTFSHSEGDRLKEGLNSAIGKNLERNLCNILKTQEQATVEVESSERNEASQYTPGNIEELDKSKTLAESESNGSGANVLEKGSKVSYQDSNCPLENIPSIQISTTEDIADVKPDFNTNETFITPKVEIMEPELKECTLPLTILALNKPESKTLQKHDVTHESKIRINGDSMADSPGLFPTQKEMLNNVDISPTKKETEVAQEKLEQPSPHLQSSEQLPQLDNISIPIINVSCEEMFHDKEDNAFMNSNVSCPQQASETPMVPIFVVPPISVICHKNDSEPKLPTNIEWTETETPAGTQRGTKKGVDKSMTTNPEITKRSDDFEEMSEKSIKENTPTVLYDALKPKVDDSVPSLSKSTEDSTIPETSKPKSIKDAKIESSMSIEDFLKSRPSAERLCSKPPTYPSLSPASLRKFMSKAAPDSDNETVTTAPVISMGQSDKAEEDLSGGSTPTSSLSCESSPRLKRRDSLTLIRSATPEELASGARRKIFIPKSKEDIEGTMVGVLEAKKETPYMSPSQARRAALLQASTGQNTPPMERRSPLLSRRKATLEVPKVMEETPSGEPASTKKEEKPTEKKADPLKAPQVIRKIRGEPFPDASGHLKLWCQFFNVLGDSTIKWYKDEEEILEVKRSGGDESQVALAIVLASSQDCGVYGCTINNEYGTDTTDYLLSTDILSEILLKDDLEVGEEIEMTPLLFAKGLADCGSWGEKYFGRIFTETLHMGDGCTHKASRVKVIYGLDPVFESGSTCIIKVQNPIAYGTKQESNLAERNLDITKQECKVQNMIREYCKIFAAEARVIENFGFSLEVIPRYLMYRPAKSVPYATVEADLTGIFVKYCTMDPKGKLSTQSVSEVEQKCCTFQHWIHQWTHGNLLVTQLEGVETRITNIKVVTKSKGYQGLTECGSPEVFDQFLTLHQCNYYCGLLGLRPLKTTESLQQPKIKGSRSPLLNRKLGSNSPQLQRKGQSPQMSRKANSSPKMVRKVQETEDSKSDDKSNPAESLSVVEIR
ncbi:titin homolog [Melanotaenia boesemani]|uniref:titin homolog n=1 Tax=Melanotaenia boesemani TaxID=1250792 RepID=UPI001C051C34|nr:titin homolog [Melanotaenia boesemani]